MNIEQLPTTSNVKHYFGLFLGYGVKILDYEEGFDLYKHGCFGKGNLSRSIPIFEKIKDDLIMTNDFHFKKTKKPFNNNNKKRSRDNDNDKLLKTPKIADDTIDEIDLSKGSSDMENVQVEQEDLNEEFLQLSLCESFFLIHSLGCLTILREDNYNANVEEEESDSINPTKPILYRMSIKECWIEFQRNDKNFVRNFIVYQYFRSIGWIPRSGLKYGCNYVLYKLKPDLIHAQYGVIIQSIPNNSSSDNNNDYLKLNDSQTLTTWEGILAINRVSESVAKGIIICNVISPTLQKDVSINNNKEINIIPLESIQLFKINTWELNRWIPAKTRQ